MKSLYNISQLLLQLLLPVFAKFGSRKLKAFADGRKNVFEHLASAPKQAIWIHVSSLGEFEQIRPLIEMIKEHNPCEKINLSFYSPSGFEQVNDKKYFDFKFYLPIDTIKNARKTISILKPKCLILVKYDLWYNYLNVLSTTGAPAILTSALFRSDQVYFKKSLPFFRHTLDLVNTIFVQNEDSKNLLLKNQYTQDIIISGDTKYDSARKNTEIDFNDNSINDFLETSRPTIIIGSAWKSDLRVILPYLLHQNINLIIAPHQVDEVHLKEMMEMNTMKAQSVYSRYHPDVKSDVLWIDVIGKLKYIYRVADLAYIGGGFQDGVHNTLEAAAYGIPIIFGPKHNKFPETYDMMQLEVAKEINSPEQFAEAYQILMSKNQEMVHGLLSQYFNSHMHATEKIYDFLLKRELIAS